MRAHLSACVPPERVRRSVSDSNCGVMRDDGLWCVPRTHAHTHTHTHAHAHAYSHTPSAQIRRILRCVYIPHVTHVRLRLIGVHVPVCMRLVCACVSVPRACPRCLCACVYVCHACARYAFPCSSAFDQAVCERPRQAPVGGQSDASELFSMTAVNKVGADAQAVGRVLTPHARMRVYSHTHARAHMHPMPP
jgi:hypothetical protein